MFWKKDSFYDHKEYWDLTRKLNELRRENLELKLENKDLKRELKAIKPVLANPQLKPAVSKDCHECRYVVKSKHDGSVLGCRKDAVCSDFVANEVIDW